MIAIVNYHMGNLRSVEKALQRIGEECVITNDPTVLRSADKLILPGVGHFGKGMQELQELGLIEVLNNLVLEEKKPILGICLGMQLMTSHSEEGDVAGLGWIDAETVRFDGKELRLKVPHIGWNEIKPTADHGLFDGIGAEVRNEFYFVHTYYVQANDDSSVAATTEYGIEFVSAVSKGNISGVQFHPEKSLSQGLRLIKNFAKS